MANTMSNGIYVDHVIDTQDWHDYCYIMQLVASGKTDYRFVVESNPEPDEPGDLYFVQVYDWVTGELISSHTSGDPGAEIEAVRQIQTCPDIEQRWNMYAQREHEERMGY